MNSYQVTIRETSMTPNEKAELRARMDSLIGSKRWITAFSKCFGRARPAVNNWFVSDESQPPAEFSAVLEFLEIVPTSKWPDRWNDLAQLKISAGKARK